MPWLIDLICSEVTISVHTRASPYCSSLLFAFSCAAVSFPIVDVTDCIDSSMPNVRAMTLGGTPRKPKA